MKDRTTERIRCYRCGMSFRVGYPRGYESKCGKRADWTTCAEEGCDRLFWHVTIVMDKQARNYGTRAGTTVCGVAPETAA